MKYEIHGSIHPVPDKPSEPESKNTSGAGAAIGGLIGLAVGSAVLGPVGAVLGLVGGIALGESAEKA